MRRCCYQKWHPCILYAVSVIILGRFSLVFFYAALCDAYNMLCDWYWAILCFREGTHKSTYLRFIPHENSNPTRIRGIRWIQLAFNMTPWSLIYLHALTLIRALISKHLPSRMWDEIAYPFPNFNGATVEVWAWISNFSPQNNVCNLFIQSTIFKHWFR